MPSISGSCWEFQAFDPAISAGNPSPDAPNGSLLQSSVRRHEAGQPPAFWRMVQTGLPGNFTQPMATGRKEAVRQPARLQLLQPRLPSLRGRARPLEALASPREITALPSRKSRPVKSTRSWSLPDENPSSIPSRSESIRRWSSIGQSQCDSSSPVDTADPAALPRRAAFKSLVRP